MRIKPTPGEIDSLLPQTQCGLCGYGGCMPYAQALAENKAPIHLCPPGGISGLLALGKLLNVDPAPYVSEMEQKIKPDRVAVIREAECIGCTKCITACPVDAILGGPKQMHTVIAKDCTGCELCIAPCPVDCIDMQIISEKEAKPDYYRDRYEKHQIRLQNEKAEQDKKIDKQSYMQGVLSRIKK